MLSRPRTPGRPLRVALVGCGQIADAHLEEISRIGGATIVAVCDCEEDLARQAAARFGISRHFTDLARLFDEMAVDVLHVTTPPQSHRAIALDALNRGIDVYVEKPFALNAAEAREMLTAAERSGRLICAGHDQVWDPAWLEYRDRAAKEIGECVHAEALQRYDLCGPFGRRVTADPDHWVRTLDGGLLHNAIPHSVYRLSAFLPPGEFPSVSAVWFARTEDFATDLHVFLKTRLVSATLTFITGSRPPGSVFRVYGTSGALEFDSDARIIRRQPDSRLPAFIVRFQTPAAHAREGVRNVVRNVRRFARGELRFFSGMAALFRAFYTAIETGGRPPIEYGEIERTVELMDVIFDTCRHIDDRRRVGEIEPAVLPALVQP